MQCCGAFGQAGLLTANSTFTN